MTEERLRWAEVDLGAVAHNVTEVRRHISEGSSLMAVVKADGYGHGAVAVGRAALNAGASWLAVSTLSEALALRAAGIDAPVMMMGPLAAGSEPAAVQADLRVAVSDPAAVARLAAAADGAAVHVHLKVDTGMGRLGCPPDEALILGRRIEAAGLQLEGLWTHFAEADDPGSGRTAQQLQRFLQVVADLAAGGIHPPVLHAANSAAALLFPSTHLAMVRCGLPIYGYTPTPVAGLDLRPVLAWKSRVVAVHQLQPGERVGYGGTYSATVATRTATVATGYADGYRRSLSNRGEVLIHGHRAPVLGRVSMDFITVEASRVPEVEVGDEVVIIGTQGDERITAGDLAATLDTISWEVLTMIGPRVERVLLRD